MQQLPSGFTTNVGGASGTETYRYNGVDAGQQIYNQQAMGTESIEVINNTDNYVLVAFQPADTASTLEARFDLVVPAFNQIVTPAHCDGFSILLQGQGNSQGNVNQVIVRTSPQVWAHMTAQLPAASQSPASSTVTVANTVSVTNPSGGTLNTAVPGGVSATIPGNVNVQNPSGVTGLPILHGINAEKSYSVANTGGIPLTVETFGGGGFGMTYLYSMTCILLCPASSTVGGIYGVQGSTTAYNLWLGSFGGGGDAFEQWVSSEVVLSYPYNLAAIQPTETGWVPILEFSTSNLAPTYYGLTFNFA